MTQPLLQAADLRGAARLGPETVADLARLLEVVQGTAAGPPGPVTASEVEARVATLLDALAPDLLDAPPHQPVRPEREALRAAFNGVFGDVLAARDHPLAIPMALRVAGRPLLPDRLALRARLTGITPRLLLLVHDLCLNDLQWSVDGHDHGAALARELGYTPVYLHYNSGLSISTNGRLLAALMERLHDAWPGPVERLVLLGHGMGGLVARSALHHGAHLQRGGLRWPARVDDLVCLGSPHHGAPLERAGHGVDRLLGAAPGAAALARLARRHSAGIEDLRRGHLLLGAAAGEADLPAAHVPLPPGTRCHALAACCGPSSGSLKARREGDGLVPQASALGQHEDPARHLPFPPAHQAVVHGIDHLALRSAPAVFQWLQSRLG